METRILIYSSEIEDNYGSIEEYKECLSTDCVIDKPLESITIEEIYNEWELENSSNWDFALDVIADLSKEHQYFLCIGSNSFWWGNAIGGTVDTNLHKLISEIINNCDIIKIEFVEGKLEVKGVHHDGTNSYTIIPLSSEGSNYINNNYDDKDEKATHDIILATPNYTTVFTNPFE